MKNIIIPREKWLRGPYAFPYRDATTEGPNYSKLLREDGMRCCVGHILSQHDVEDKEMMGAADTSDVTRHMIPYSLEWLTGDDGNQLYGINDGTVTCSPYFGESIDYYEKYPTDAEREAEIQKVCLKHDMNVIFTGERLPLDANGKETFYKHKPHVEGD